MARSSMVDGGFSGVISIGTAIGLLVHIIRAAMTQGKLDQRVKHLEENATDTREARDGVIRLEGKVEAMRADITEIKDGLKWVTRVAGEAK